MLVQRIAFTSLVTFCAIVSTSLPLDLAASLLVPKALAQTLDQDIEVDRRQRIIEYQQKIQLARDKRDHLSESMLLRALGDEYYCQADWKNAIANYEKGMAIAKENGANLEAGLVQAELGKVLFQVGNFTQAEAILRDGIRATEDFRLQIHVNDSRNLGEFETQQESHRYLQQALIAQNKTDAALEIAEQGRARAFAELLTRRQSANSEAPLSITPPNLQKIQQIAKTEKATLVQYSLVYEEFGRHCKRHLWASEIFIWVIQPTGEVAFRRVELKSMNQKLETSLEGLIHQSRASIGVGERGLAVTSRNDNYQSNNNQQLQKLHQLLIEPIVTLLPQNPDSHVIFIPQNCLFYVPFPALQDSSGKYLIEKHTMLTSPSIQVLELTHQQQQRQRTGQGALVVGNPAPMPKNLASLPGAEQEAKAIAQVLNTQAITGTQATKATVLQQLSKVRLIHLATHGLLDDLFGLDSAIALALPGKSNQVIHLIISDTQEVFYTDDGLLTADEILNLKLDAELVVLSACDTGLGEITGDGVIGLSRALFVAGVPSVVVSLWSIPDAPTASLMIEFYSQLQQKQNKAQALRSAMLATMKQHPNPRNWAAFTLIGEAE